MNNPLLGRIFEVTETRVGAVRTSHWGEEFEAKIIRKGEHFIYVADSKKPGYCYAYTFVNVCKAGETGLVHLGLIARNISYSYIAEGKTIFQIRNHFNDINRKLCDDYYRSSLFELPMNVTTLDACNKGLKDVLEKLD